MTRPRTVGELVAALSAFPSNAELVVDGMGGDVVIVAVSRAYSAGQPPGSEPTGPVVLEAVPAEGFALYAQQLNERMGWLGIGVSFPCWCNDPTDRSRDHSEIGCPRRADTATQQEERK